MPPPVLRLSVLAVAVVAGMGLGGAPASAPAGGTDAASAAEEAPAMPDDAAIVTVPVPADVGRPLALVVLQLGALPAGAAVTVARADGTILGGYAPFGPDSGPSTTRIPLPGGWPEDGLTLRIWVEEDDGTRRAPTDRELRSVAVEGLP